MSHLVADLGWVDLDLGEFPWLVGYYSKSVATYCQGRVVKHPKSKSTQPTAET